jgi:hypothetical protein
LAAFSVIASCSCHRRCPPTAIHHHHLSSIDDARYPSRTLTPPARASRAQPIAPSFLGRYHQNQFLIPPPTSARRRSPQASAASDARPRSTAAQAVRHEPSSDPHDRRILSAGLINIYTFGASLRRSTSRAEPTPPPPTPTSDGQHLGPELTSPPKDATTAHRLWYLLPA